MSNRQKTGRQFLVDHLVCNGIDRVFSVPGESFLGAKGAFFERGNEIQFVNCRQAGGAAFNLNDLIERPIEPQKGT
jgi:acetolactate synthase-1/2/3 large subunit